MALLLERVATLLLELSSLVGSETNFTGGNPWWYCKPDQKLMTRKIMGDEGSEKCYLTNEHSIKLPSKSTYTFTLINIMPRSETSEQ